MSEDESAATGIIGQTQENGFPVIWKFVNELPAVSERQLLPWLAVISWKYDGSMQNGMPPQEINKQMRELESGLAEQVLAVGTGRHAYSRTGHDLKELVYYIADRDEFMKKLNAALADHPPYPIEIEFYADSEWGDFQRLLSNFSKAST